MTTIPRRIHFYDLDFRVSDDSGSLHVMPDPAAVFEFVRALPPAPADPTRYLRLHDENDLLIDIAEITAAEVRGRFAIKRRMGLPAVEEAGAYSDLALAADAGLAEIRHFIFYPPQRLLGIEVNGNAPGISRFCQYLVTKAPHIVDLVIPTMRLAGSVADTLQRVTRIAGATISVKRDNLQTLAALDPQLEAGLEQIADGTNAMELRVVLELGSRKRSESLEVPWKNQIQAFLGVPGQREALEELKLRAFDTAANRTQDIDLLEDRFVGFRQVLTINDASRTIDAESMFMAINDVAQTMEA